MTGGGSLKPSPFEARLRRAPQDDESQYEIPAGMRSIRLFRNLAFAGAATIPSPQRRAATHQPVDDGGDIHQSLTIERPNGTLGAGIKGLYSNRK